MTTERIAGWLLLTVLSAGCSGESEPQAVEDPEEHACEHAEDMSDGTAVTASTSADSAPVLEASEEPYLVDFAEGARGYVAVTGPGDALLFVGQADAVARMTFEETAGDLLPESAPVEHCSELIPEHYDLELAEPGTYRLELATASPPLWLMYLSAEGHGHD